MHIYVVSMPCLMLLCIPLHLEIITFCGTNMQYSIKLFGKLSFNLRVPGIIIVTCSRKRDCWEFFINIEFLAWIDSSVCTEYNGKSFKETRKNIDHKQSYDRFYAVRWIELFFGK